jgi:hypothetical protein
MQYVVEQFESQIHEVRNQHKNHRVSAEIHIE